MNFKRMVFLVGLFLMGGLVGAQDSTPSAPASTINWFFAVCDNRAVIDLDGTMQSGYDIYLQVFRETGASGTSLSNAIRVPVDGAYKTSQVINYPTGVTLGLGQFGSIRITMARESDPTSTIFVKVVDDVYDTCISPANAQGSSTSLGSVTSPSGTFIDPQTGQTVQAVAGQPIRTSGILKPGGGYLNPVFAVPSEQPVQIGARPSQNTRESGRVSDVGLLFAECDQFPGADPGRLYDTDNLTVFWSWYAKTAAQVRDHIAKAQYRIFFDSPGLPTQIFPNVVVSPIVKREDGNFYVFYTVALGNSYRPGNYRVNYAVSWTEPTFDGFNDFGPGTETEELTGTCTWDIEQNPFGTQVNYTNPRIFSPGN
jgi:hypothetical protein